LIRGIFEARATAPELVCEVVFMKWTGHAHIRHGSFHRAPGVSGTLNTVPPVSLLTARRRRQ
jgi:hypothetical protein